MGSTGQSGRNMNAEFKKMTQCGWDNWMNMSGVLCDMRIPPHVKGMVHNMIVEPPMVAYGMKALSMTSFHVKKLEMTDMKMMGMRATH